MTAQEAAKRGDLRLAREELARIEHQIGTGSARNAYGQWSAAQARRLNRLRYREATYRARVGVLEKAAA
jgi:hypothetical protein